MHASKERQPISAREDLKVQGQGALATDREAVAKTNGARGKRSLRRRCRLCLPNTFGCTITDAKGHTLPKSYQLSKEPTDKRTNTTLGWQHRCASAPRHEADRSKTFDTTLYT